MNSIIQKLPSERNNKPIKVYTLGRFLVCDEKGFFSDVQPKSHKLWDLFKYLLTNKNRDVPIENIIESLSPDISYEDPKNAVQNQVYRLRKLIKSATRLDEADNCILFANSCYRLNADIFDIDTDNFEALIKLGKDAMAKYPNSALSFYQRAIDLYWGEYLPELAYTEWVMPVKNYYRRIYIQCCQDLLSILESQGRYQDIIITCEKILLIEPYEEDIHLRFLRALAAVGNTRQAFSHYEYITGVFYNQFKLKPSNEMRQIYHALTAAASNTIDEYAVASHISATKDLYDEGLNEGAYYCDMQTFRSVYILFKRQSDRSQHPGYLIRVDSFDQSTGHSDKYINEIKEVLIDSLRKGDAVSYFGNGIFYIMLSNVQGNGIEKIIKRLHYNIITAPQLKSIDINTRYQMITSSTNLNKLDEYIFKVKLMR